MTQPLDRETILEAARRQFARHGFRKTSLADIVRSLGVGKTAIYHHFPGGKGEIVDCCLRHGEEAIFARVRAAVDSQWDPRDQLRAMILTKMEQLHELRASFAISAGVGRELVEIYQQHERRFNTFEELLLKAILVRGQGAGIFRTTDASKLAHALRVNLQHLEVPIVFEMDRERLEEHVDLILDLVLHGILSQEQRTRQAPEARKGSARARAREGVRATPPAPARG
jgi:AcrR family transcriptional regulator